MKPKQKDYDKKHTLFKLFINMSYDSSTVHVFRASDNA